MGNARPLYPGEKNASPHFKLPRTFGKKLKEQLGRKDYSHYEKNVNSKI